MKLKAQLDGSLNLTGTEATGADVNRTLRTVDKNLDLSDVGLPSSAALSVRVRNIVTEAYGLITITALCHNIYLLKKSLLFYATI